MKFPPKSNSVAAFAMLAIISLPALASAFSSSPPDGRTNAPGETNCTACHNSFGFNSGTGTLSVTDISNWEPGQTYDLTVTLDDPDASRWGFEFTILDGAGDSAGTLSSLDSHTQISNGSTRDYAKQTSAGTQNGTTGSASWTVRWTAPEAGAGDLTLYMVGNGANGNFSTSGDRIYGSSVAWSEGGISSAPMPLLAGAQLQPNYPNPFNPRTTLAFELDQARDVQLAIYSLDGRLVKQLAGGTYSAGRHEVMWDGLDSHGRATSSGTYLYRLISGHEVQTRTMTLVR